MWCLTWVAAHRSLLARYCENEFFKTTRGSSNKASWSLSKTKQPRSSNGFALPPISFPPLACKSCKEKGPCPAVGGSPSLHTKPEHFFSTRTRASRRAFPHQTRTYNISNTLISCAMPTERPTALQLCKKSFSTSCALRPPVLRTQA